MVGPSYIIKDKENGILVPVNNTKAIEQAINLIIEDEEINYKLSENANKTKRDFTIEKIAQEWEKIILDIKKGK